MAETTSRKHNGFLSRLRKDEAGNTIALIGAALLPITLMVGGGIDISRSYMVQARLQQACDAGALAGRKSVGDGTFDAKAKERAEALFNANFPDRYLNSKNTVFDPTASDSGAVVMGRATTTLPNVVMNVFGFEEKTISVECQARLEVANADITLVLDTTGSMKEEISGSPGTTRIAGLRSAALSFYDVMADAASGTNARVRYGFVPYSSTINAGRVLMNEDPSYILGGSGSKTVAYQTRRPVYNVPSGSWEYHSVENMTFRGFGSYRPAYTTQGECNNDGSNDNFQNNVPTDRDIVYQAGFSFFRGDWTPFHNGYSEGNPANREGDTNYQYRFEHNSWNYFRRFTVGGFTRDYGRCSRRVFRRPITQTYDHTESGAIFSHYEYGGVHSWPVNGYVQTLLSGNTVVDPTDNQLDNPDNVRWAGCIEERQTSPQSSFTYNRADGEITPAGALDLDIDSAPTNDASRWRPYWPEVSYYQDGSTPRKPQVACPSEVKLLQKWERDDFNTELNDLNPDGGTYHDIGAIWAGRISSPDGIFADTVNEDPDNGSFVSRHVIFMTDGQLDTGPTLYSIYGIESYDQRVTAGNVSTQDSRHISRFRAVCEAIKAKNIRLWVIAFDTALSQDLIDCASANSSFVSSSASSLNDTFVEIAQAIADLRLSQ